MQLETRDGRKIMLRFKRPQAKKYWKPQTASTNTQYQTCLHLHRSARPAGNGSALQHILPSNLSLWKAGTETGGSDLGFGQIRTKTLPHKMPLSCLETDRALHCGGRQCVHEQNEMTWMMLKPLWWSKNNGLPSLRISHWSKSKTKTD